MAATADNSPHSVIYFDISVRNQARQQKVTARDAAPSSHAQQRETDTWRTKNASHDGRQTPIGKRQG